MDNQPIEHATAAVSEGGRNTPDAMLQIIRVRVQDTHYAIALKYVECVLPLMELQPVPGGADYLVGLMNYHGNSLVVVDLSMWLGLQSPAMYHLNTPLVVCGDSCAQIALVVDEVMQVEGVQPSAIHMRDLFKEGNAPFEASLSLDSGITLLLDMPRILNINFTRADSFFSQVQHLSEN